MSGPSVSVRMSRAVRRSVPKVGKGLAIASARERTFLGHGKVSGTQPAHRGGGDQVLSGFKRGDLDRRLSQVGRHLVATLMREELGDGSRRFRHTDHSDKLTTIPSVFAGDVPVGDPIGLSTDSKADATVVERGGCFGSSIPTSIMLTLNCPIRKG
jgi:hypothetical protein